MVLDHRDQRLQSPFQGWLLDEILTNANARISITSDVRLLRSPTTGYHCNIFMMKTLDNFKMVLVGSMTSYGSVPCGRWDSETGAVLSHAAFQPFRWPIMRNDSPTWVDVKVKMEGQLLVHLELRGYRSDGDMTVQINHVSDTIVWLLQETPFIPTFVVTVFQGWRVCAVSWEVGGRIYMPFQKEGSWWRSTTLFAMWSCGSWQHHRRMHLVRMPIGWSFAFTVLLIGWMWPAALVQFHHRGWWSAVCQVLP